MGGVDVMVSADSGPDGLTLLLMLPLTTSARRLSPPQAGAAGAEATATEPLLTPVVVAVTSETAFDVPFGSFKAIGEATVLAVTLTCV